MTASGSEHAFAYLRKLVHDSAAIVLEADKRYLFEARLEPILRDERVHTFDELVARLHEGDAGPLRLRVVQAMTTHETSFFRDAHPFEAFRTHVVPQLLVERAATRRLSIWCGAASTGQEPYSLAFIIKDHAAALAGWTVSLLATDLSVDVIVRARSGLFSQLEVNRGLPPAMLARYFDRAGADWRVKEEVRRMVELRRFNLVASSWQQMPDLDVAFLRNVLIYFDVTTKKEILARLHRILRPGGYLFLGASETTLNLCAGFRPVQLGKATCYQRI